MSKPRPGLQLPYTLLTGESRAPQSLRRRNGRRRGGGADSFATETRSPPFRLLCPCSNEKSREVLQHGLYLYNIMKIYVKKVRYKYADGMVENLKDRAKGRTQKPSQMLKHVDWSAIFDGGFQHGPAESVRCQTSLPISRYVRMPEPGAAVAEPTRTCQHSNHERRPCQGRM